MAAKLSSWPVLLAVLLGFVLTLGMFAFVRGANQERLAGNFERETNNLGQVTQQRFDSYLGVLYSLRDYFEAEGDVSRQAFGVFARGQLARHPGIQALEWVPAVDDADRDRFEAEARRQGLSGFYLSDRDGAGRLVPAPRRPQVYPVFYVEPLAGNERALGYAPVLPPRDEAIARARDTNRPVASARFQTVQTDLGGVAVFLPVYQKGTAPGDVAGRRRHLRGFIEGVFLPDDMLKAPLDDARAAGISATLTDESAPEPLRSLLPEASAAGVTEAPGTHTLRRELPLEMAGRKWLLTFNLTHPRFMAGLPGQEWWVLVGGFAATGLLGGYLSSVLNQRRRVEQMVVERTRALSREKELAQKYLNVAAVMIVKVEADGRVSLINRQGSEILGHPQEAIVGRDWFESFVPARERLSAQRFFASILDNGSQAHFFESPVLTREGEERLIAWNCIKVCNEDGRVCAVLSSGADVTDYKRAIEEVAKRGAALTQARENERLKNNFTSAVSHDLRTPLTSIMGYAEFLEDGIGGTLSSQQQGYVGQIRRGAQRLEHLVDDLLDFARLDAGTFQLRRHPADLGALVSEVAESLGPLVDEAHLRLEVEVAEGLAAPLDTARIERVLFNLLHNALKFTPPGGAVRVRAWAEGALLRCEVQDTGIGVSEAQAARLFQPFSQLQSGSEKGGTGLGLSICKAIVAAHGGDIGVRSEVGAGAVFWFTLPKGRA